MTLANILVILQSRAIIAGIISILSTLLGMVGVTVDDEAVTNGVIAIASAGAGVWYRYRAKNDLSPEKKGLPPISGDKG